MKSLGWIKLHRKLLENAIFTSEKGLKVWIWCLLKANHDENEVFMNMQKLTIKSGQFIFGRESASKELKMSPSTVRNWLGLLKKDSYLDIKPTNKYSVITVLKYSDYQEMNNKKDNRITTEKQQNNTNNNDNNEKNVLHNATIQDSPALFDFDKEMQNRDNDINTPSKPKTVGEVYLETKKAQVTSSVSQEFQVQALDIIEALNIRPNRKGAYFAAVKRFPRVKILEAYAFAVDYPKREMRDKIFFWKLNNKHGKDK